jgi:hypothetical protein
MKRPAAISISDALLDQRLLGGALGSAETWSTWIAVLKSAYAEPLTATEREAFDRVAGGRAPPSRKVKELAAVASRRAGKGRAAGALAAYESALVDHRALLAPGEVGVVACISPTRAQAQIVKNYTLGFFEGSNVLRGEIAEVTADEIRLRNGNVICTLVSDYRTLRGRTLLLAILDEASFLKNEASNASDIEAARALLPGLSTTHGMLCILSSPYRRAGLLFQRYRDFFARDDDGVLVVAGPSTIFNPTLDEGEIAAARAADPVAASSEWFGAFRDDITGFLTDALIDAAVEHDRPLELPPRGGVHYRAFTDSAGGVGQDAYTVAIASKDGAGRVVIDVVRGTSGKFDPQSVTWEYAQLLKEYGGLRQVTGDSYGAEWVATAWQQCGVTYIRSERTKSELYLEALPLFTRGLMRLPDHPKLLRELRMLERYTHRSGRDSVDHPRNGGRDDHANAACGAAVLVGGKVPLRFPPELIARMHRMPRYERPLMGDPMNFWGERRWLQMQRAQEMRR